MAKALREAGFDVVPLGPLAAPSLPVARVQSKLRRTLGLRHQSPAHTERVAREYAADAARRITALSPDVVFAPAGSPFAWAVPRSVPLVYTSDATFALIEDFYARYANLSRRGRAVAERLERDTVARADLLLYPSRWAADSVIRDYGADPARVHVVEWGANLAADVEAVAARPQPPQNTVRLLFVGVDWARKGGAVAQDALVRLRRCGIDATLTVCGCIPPSGACADGVTVIPFLDKADPADRARLDALYRQADVFILPTRAECYGIVFCEASAYGVPSLAPATGGVSGAVRDGENGLLLPPEATGADYAAAIRSLLDEPGRFAALRRSSRAAFEDRLNWRVWGQRTAALIDAL
jgi:glycosyltransferase involved in cell wall biosynthesis